MPTRAKPTNEQDKKMTAAFTLGDAELAAISPTAGRKAKPSIYLEEVKGAIGKDKAFGILVTDAVKPTTMVSELHKAAKELGVKVKVWDRSKLAEKPFIGFRIKTEAATPAAATADATAAK